MGVYIKGLQMPKAGSVQILINADGMVSIYQGLGKADYYEAIPVSDHGDLIDRDELILNSGMCVSDFGTPDEQWRPDRDWYLGINAQTIIIPAERSEDATD